MKKWWIALALLLAVMLTCAQAETELRWIDGQDADRVHLREEASSKSRSLGLYFTGTSVEVIDEENGWAEVVIDGCSGYVDARYLADAPRELAGPWKYTLHPEDDWVNLFAWPSVGTLAQVRNGTYVHLLGETADGWSYVDDQGYMGYMRTDELSSQADEDAFRDTQIVGMTPSGDFIHRYVAPNGQELYWTAMEEEPRVAFQDVNFDGVTDLTVVTSRGASNFYTELFVYDRKMAQYVRVEVPGIDYPLCNYQLYPESGLVVSKANNGSAGALHETCLFRWEGMELKLLRRLVSEERSETTFDFTENSYTTTVWMDQLYVRIWDYRTGGYEGTLVYEQVFTGGEWRNADWYAQINDILWQGVSATAYIQQYVVNTGFDLRLISISEGKMEEEVLVSLADMGTSHDIALDVSFDGIADIVHLTLTDTGKVTAAFDVYADGQYIPVTYPGTLTAFQLYPRYAIVRSNGGTPDALETCLYRWEGAKLTLIRRLTLVSEGDSVRVEAWDCKHDSEALLYGKTMTQEERMTDAAQNEIDDALWQGIIR